MFRASPERRNSHEGKTHGKKDPQHVGPVGSARPQADSTASRKTEKGGNHPESTGQRSTVPDPGEIQIKDTPMYTTYMGVIFFLL